MVERDVLARAQFKMGTRRVMMLEHDPISACLHQQTDSVDLDPLVDYAVNSSSSGPIDILYHCDGRSKDYSTPVEETGDRRHVDEHELVCQNKILKTQLQEAKVENVNLRRQIKQQHEDLSELDSAMGELEAQVDDHELIIKHQDQRIREQEEMIKVLNAKMQEYSTAARPSRSIF